MGYVDNVSIDDTSYDLHDKRANGMQYSVTGTGTVYGRFAQGSALSVAGTANADVLHTSGNLLSSQYTAFTLDPSGDVGEPTTGSGIRVVQKKLKNANGTDYTIPAGKYLMHATFTPQTEGATPSNNTKCQIAKTSSSGRYGPSATTENGLSVIEPDAACTNFYAVVPSNASCKWDVSNVWLVPYSEAYDGTNGSPEVLTIGQDGTVSCVSFGGDHFIPSSGSVTVTGATNAAGRLATIEQALAELQAIVLESDN